MKNLLIIDKSKHEIFEAFFEENKITNVLNISAKSTSRNFLLSLLNLSEIKKCVYLFASTKNKLDKIEQFASQNLNKDSSGLLISIKKDNKKMKGKTIKTVKNNKLIVVVIRSGFAELVLNATKGFEVSGATILDAKGVGQSQTEFLGMNIESQREVVLVATTDALEKKIVKALKEILNNNQNANGIIFTLPIERFVKFNKQN